MIPAQNLTAWSKYAPWSEQKQVEQDLIISRSLINLFNDDFLRAQLRLRGGTALNKLHFPKPLRYSEDIDLVRTTDGGIGEILDRTRAVLEPWLGHARLQQSEITPKFRFRVTAEDETTIKLKLEINTREREVYDKPVSLPFKMDNPWFSGSADIPTYSNEEILATKLRALLQRNKGRDLLDLSHALDVFKGLDTASVVEMMGHYLAANEMTISRMQAEERMFRKLALPAFLADVRPLLTQEERERFDDAAETKAFTTVFANLIRKIPGNEWARTPGMLERYKLTDLMK
jgi:predicted nucleotidyltransferase component of viral defense system